MLTFRDVQNVLIEQAVRQAQRQLPLTAQLGRQMNRQGAPPRPLNDRNAPNLLRADEQALDAPGVVLTE